MSITINFWAFFFVIVVLGLLGTAVIYLLVCPKTHKHYHYYEYATSKDYDRLYDLMIVKGATACLVKRNEKGKICEYITAGPDPWNEYRPVKKYYVGYGDGSMTFDSKESFIGYCQYRNVEFLELEKEVREDVY